MSWLVNRSWRSLGIGLIAACSLWGSAQVHAAASGCAANTLRGVSFAGAEFNAGQLPGVLYRDYMYPSASQYGLFSGYGASVYRLPVIWERLQPVLGGALAADQVQQLKAAYAGAKAQGDCLVIDLHNYGNYRGNPLGSTSVPVTAFQDFWLQVAKVLPDDAYVTFGLMNEPVAVSNAAWAQYAQATVLRLRASGVPHYVWVSGGGWNGGQSWFTQDGSGISNAKALASFQDPRNRTYIEVHQYADADYSGTGATCQASDAIVAKLQAVSDWAEQNGKRLVLGEFGVPDNAACLTTLQGMLAHMQSRSKAWAGWAYWAAGEWMTEYPLTVQPTATRTPKQLQLLKQYFNSSRFVR